MRNSRILKKGKTIKNKIKKLFQFIKKNDLCFDIGANEGDQTSLFLELGAKVVSVEPQRL